MNDHHRVDRCPCSARKRLIPAATDVQNHIFEFRNLTRRNALQRRLYRSPTFRALAVGHQAAQIIFTLNAREIAIDRHSWRHLSISGAPPQPSPPATET